MRVFGEGSTGSSDGNSVAIVSRASNPPAFRAGDPESFGTPEFP